MTYTLFFSLNNAILPCVTCSATYFPENTVDYCSEVTLYFIIESDIKILKLVIYSEVVNLIAKVVCIFKTQISKYSWNLIDCLLL